MKAWTTKAIIEKAAKATGVRVSNLREDGSGVRFTLKTHGPTTTGKPVKYGRRSTRVRNKDGSRRRIPGAVCWHGHRDFFRSVYDLDPDVRIKTALADYKDAANFEETFRATYDQRNGYFGVLSPAAYGEVCDCKE